MTFQTWLASLRIVGDKGDSLTDPMGVLSFAKDEYHVETKEDLDKALREYLAPFRPTAAVREAFAKVWRVFEIAREEESVRLDKKRKARLLAFIG